MTTSAWMRYVIEPYYRAMRRIGVVWLWERIFDPILDPYRRYTRRRRAAQLHELADMLSEISPARSVELRKLADR